MLASGLGSRFAQGTITYPFDRLRGYDIIEKLSPSKARVLSMSDGGVWVLRGSDGDAEKRTYERMWRGLE
jgi:hypothetical protein